MFVTLSVVVETYHAVREAVHQLLKELGHDGIIGREVVLPACEQDRDRQQTVLDLLQISWGLSLLPLEIDGQETTETALQLNICRPAVTLPWAGHGGNEALEGRQRLRHDDLLTRGCGKDSGEDMDDASVKVRLDDCWEHLGSIHQRVE